MGHKLSLNPGDELFNIGENKVEGFSGGCYCCGQQIHIKYSNSEILPLAQIDGDAFRVLICNSCEEDIEAVKISGEKEVSFDILWFLQESLNEELIKLADENSSWTKQDRVKILIDLYKEYKLNIDTMKEPEVK